MVASPQRIAVLLLFLCRHCFHLMLPRSSRRQAQPISTENSVLIEPSLTAPALSSTDFKF
jgi:hypothetical protein